MEHVDIIVALPIIALYGAGFLFWAAAGNAFAGKRAEFFHPMMAAKTKTTLHGATARDDYLLTIFFLLYWVLAAGSLYLYGARMRQAIRRLLGRDARPARRAVGQVESATSRFDVAATASAGPTPTASTTSISPKSSRKRIGRSKSQSRPSPRRSLTPPERRVDVPNVMRSSVVASNNQIIPSLPRLSMNEDTDDKLSRLLKKFDSIDATQSNITIKSQDSEEDLGKQQEKKKTKTKTKAKNNMEAGA